MAPGPLQILIVVLLILVVFGASRLPMMLRAWHVAWALRG